MIVQSARVGSSPIRAEIENRKKRDVAALRGFSFLPSLCNICFFQAKEIRVEEKLNSTSNYRANISEYIFQILNLELTDELLLD